LRRDVPEDVADGPSRQPAGPGDDLVVDGRNCRLEAAAGGDAPRDGAGELLVDGHTLAGAMRPYWRDFPAGTVGS
jgi:hypothetical protein